MSKTEKTWTCKICGYVHEGEKPPDTCPICRASSTQFQE